MKKLIILLTLFIVGCSSPTENSEQENNSDTNASDLIGTWIYETDVVSQELIFNQNGKFEFNRSFNGSNTVDVDGSYIIDNVQIIFYDENNTLYVGMLCDPGKYEFLISNNTLNLSHIEDNCWERVAFLELTHIKSN